MNQTTSDLAQIYADYSYRLYAKNIRHFLGTNTPANEGMVATLRENPENFWYFNNGITAIANRFEKKAVGGASHQSGIFSCKNVSIVNGAQTVGSIHAIWLKDPEKTNHARVPIRIISLEDTPEDFDKQITSASNTQNRIDAKNFVALDPEQERLRIELIIDGIEYEYRQSETFSTSENSFELNEATIALACAQQDIALVTRAKSKISALWANIETGPYKRLFNRSVSGPDLWAKVKKIRIINSKIKAIEKREKEKNLKIAITGSLFLQHLAYHKANLGARNLDTEIERTVEALHEATCQAVEELYPDSYPANVFKNAEKCGVLKNRVLRDVAR